MDFKAFYTQHYKKLLIIPVIILALALISLAATYQQTGDIIEKDVSLRGGISATVYTEKAVDVISLETTLKETFGDAQVRDISAFGTDRHIGFSLTISDMDEDKLKSLLEEEVGIVLTDENFSLEMVGSTLGASFYRQMMKSIIFAFIFMAIIVFIMFRSLVPSLNVIFAAFGDIVITLAVISLMGVRISSSGIAALLLLIGYSIDTDVLMTTRILKRNEGTIFDRFFNSMKTGLTMTVTTLVALSVAYLFSTSETLKQMFLIINVGLIIDVVFTYLGNAPILLMYAKKKEGSK